MPDILTFRPTSVQAVSGTPAWTYLVPGSFVAGDSQLASWPSSAGNQTTTVDLSFDLSSLAGKTQDGQIRLVLRHMGTTNDRFSVLWGPHNGSAFLGGNLTVMPPANWGDSVLTQLTGAAITIPNLQVAGWRLRFIVTRTNQGGSHTYYLSQAYVEVPVQSIPPPDLIGIAPTRGHPRGGDLVRIGGTGFQLESPVTVGFGGQDVAVSVVSDTELNVYSPQHDGGMGEGPVDVVVAAPRGLSRPVTFTYELDTEYRRQKVWNGSDWEVKPMMARAANATWVRRPVRVVQAEDGYAALIRTHQPVAHWPLDDANGGDGARARELIEDRHGTYHGAVSAGPGISGSGRLAAALDNPYGLVGAGYVEVPFNPWLSPGPAFTIEAWVAPASLQNRAEAIVTARSARQPGNIGGIDGYLLVRAGGGGNLEVQGWVANQQSFAQAGVIDWQIGAWRHVAVMARNDAGTWRCVLWVNGVQRHDPAIFGNNVVVNPSAPTYIGRQADPEGAGVYGDIRSWDGRICHVALYPRALSAGELLDHYNAGIGENLGDPWWSDDIPRVPFVTHIDPPTWSLAGGYREYAVHGRELALANALWLYPTPQTSTSTGTLIYADPAGRFAVFSMNNIPNINPVGNRLHCDVQVAGQWVRNENGTYPTLPGAVTVVA